MKDRRIILGVTGGIAAYKAAELVRLLIKAEARVRVAMTRNAARFITPLTFEALSGHRVIQDMFEEEGTSIPHIRWGQASDLVVIAPATANFIAKMAGGIADDFLSTLAVAATARILVCPAMNTHMYQNAAVQHNIRVLEERGVAVMKPGEGFLACRSEGPGRLPDPADIVEQIRVLLAHRDYSGLRVLVTAGPTVEPLDPVRFISNRSSGKMGYAVARAAMRRGASVTLVSGPTSLRPPPGVRVVDVRTAEDMRRAVLDAGPESDVVIKAAAVSDYRPRERAAKKIKKGPETLSLELVKNPDILAELGQARGERPRVLVGFAAETDDLLAHATEKLKAKNLDMIVANDVSRDDAGFESDTNAVRVIHRDGRVEDCPLMSKEAVADFLLDRIRAVLRGKD
ncbi:MAG: bifunctional phosphopantothenoylcysteine decarboxylase/phosphopantothenate--cysteine ligase CoaBC [Deltaproteobacteria bacterium]|nr:MAG: bifunctional phosphopantothenoylcysteine decarboxylase/phosphopantothenate--cysteine ligase CoaBC [Deltaproteobacteria bacterium]